MVKRLGLKLQHKHRVLGKHLRYNSPEEPWDVCYAGEWTLARFAILFSNETKLAFCKMNDEEKKPA